jgi:hypothetical protein
MKLPLLAGEISRIIFGGTRAERARYQARRLKSKRVPLLFGGAHPRPLRSAEPDIPSRPGRIMMVSTALGVGGGAEEQVMLLSLGLRGRGWGVKIVSLVPLSSLAPELTASDIALASLDMKPGIPDPRAMLGLIKELRSFQPDVVHCHMPQANLLARAVRPFQPFPVLISTLQNLTMERVNGGSGRFLELAHGWTDRFSDLTTVRLYPRCEQLCAAGRRAGS